MNLNETHCSYGYYQDTLNLNTSEYVKKNGRHHASFNATPPILHNFIRSTATLKYLMEST